MANEQSPFVTQTLKPRSLDQGRSEGFYELHAASVAPTVYVGRDAAGRPIEETRPICYSRRFVTQNGDINWVPLRTGAVYSKAPAEERYEMLTSKELIEAGWIPLECCPYSYEYKHITGGMFAAPQNGETDCGGDKTALEPNRIAKGCEHLQAIMKVRAKAALERYHADQKLQASIKPDDVKALFAGFGDSLASAIHGDGADLKARKKALVNEQSTVK